MRKQKAGQKAINLKTSSKINKHGKSFILRKIKKYNYQLILNTFSIIFTSFVAFYTLYKTQIEPNYFRPIIDYTDGNHEFFDVYARIDKLVIYKQLELTNTGKIIGFISRPELWIINKDNLDQYVVLSECFHGRESSMLFRSFNIQSNGLFGQEVRYESRISRDQKKGLTLIKEKLYSENYYLNRDSLSKLFLNVYKRSDAYSAPNISQLIINKNYVHLKNETKSMIADFLSENGTSVLREGSYYLVEGAWLQDNSFFSRYFSFNLDSNDVAKYMMAIHCYEEGFGIVGNINDIPLLRIELELVTSEIDLYRIESFLGQF